MAAWPMAVVLDRNMTFKADWRRVSVSSWLLTTKEAAMAQSASTQTFTNTKGGTGSPPAQLPKS
eukprot:scaffold273_cov242-Pinguiococcus_pyrenoidosus.AAC.3